MSNSHPIKTDLSKHTDADAAVQYQAVYDGMKTNVFFSHPDIAYDDFLDAGTDFGTKLSASIHGTPTQTAAKNAARELLNQNYCTQGFYVIRTSNGNLEMLTSSKYVLSQEKAPVTLPDVEVKNGENPGELIFKFKAVDKARAYLVESRIIGETETKAWNFCKVFGSCNGTKDGFTIGDLIEFRMKVIYSKSEGPYFESVRMKVGYVYAE